MRFRADEASPPLPGRAQLRDAFNIRLNELTVRAIAFLHGTSQPTLAILHEDTEQNRHVQTYTVVAQKKELEKGPWSARNVDNNANLLVAVPAPIGGLIVVGVEVHAGLLPPRRVGCAHRCPAPSPRARLSRTSAP